MIALLKYLDGRWEDVRGYLKSDLEHIESVINSNWASAFSSDGSLNPGTILGDSSPATRYVANTGPENAPKWDQVNLANGVKGRLDYPNLPLAQNNTVMGRRFASSGDYESVECGDAIATSMAPSPIFLNVKFDESTIDINGSNELEVVAPFFDTVAVSGQSDVVADSVGDTLTLAAGTGIVLTTTPGTDTVTIASSGASNTFSTVAVSGQSDVVADTATDTLTLAAGTGITLTTNASTDTVTITNSAAAQNTFSTVAVSGQSDVVADSSTDTLTLVAGTNVTLTTSAGGDSVTITASGSGAVGDLLDQQYIRKTGDQNVSLSTAYVSDDTLNVAIGASQEWIIDWHLILTGNSSGDFKFALNVPSGATGYMSIISALVTTAGATNADAVLTATTDLTDTANFAVATVTGVVTTATIRGIIVNSTNAGTVTLRWAQNVSNGTATTVKAMSHVIASRFV